MTNIDPKTRKLGLSIKAREIAEEKEAVEQYGSSDSGASLGDILGAALKGPQLRPDSGSSCLWIRKAPLTARGLLGIARAKRMSGRVFLFVQQSNLCL